MDHTPAECVRILIELVKQGQVISLTFAKHVAHVIAYALDLLDRENEPPIFGADTQEAEFTAALADLCAVLPNGKDDEAFSGPFGPWMVKIALQQLIAYLADQIASGEIQQWIDKLLDLIKNAKK